MFYPSKVCIALSGEIFLTFEFSYCRPCYFACPGSYGVTLKEVKWKNLGWKPTDTCLPMKPAKFWLVNTPRLSSHWCTTTTPTFGNFSCVNSSTLSFWWSTFPSLTSFWAASFGGTGGECMITTRINSTSMLDPKSMRDQRLCVHCFLQSLRKIIF